MTQNCARRGAERRRDTEHRNAAEQSFSADSLPDARLVGKKDWTASFSRAAGLGKQVHSLTKEGKTLKEDLQALKKTVNTVQQAQEANALEPIC